MSYQDNLPALVKITRPNGTPSATQAIRTSKQRLILVGHTVNRAWTTRFGSARAFVHPARENAKGD
jgi:hypothetical protein